MNNLDIIYIFKEFDNHEELRYSLRSLEKNFPHNKIYIVYEGEPLSDITNVTWVKANMQEGYKYDKEIDKLRQIALDDRFTDDFIFFQDDLFILKPVTNLEYYYTKTLDDTLEKLAKTLGKCYAYYIWLEQANKALKERGMTTYNCELHAPIIFNRKKLLKVLDEFPGIYCTRTLYCNYYQLPLVQVEDNKASIFGLDYNPDYWVLSTDDQAFNFEEVGEFIRNRFPEPCKYEKAP